jgi:hypothetical protein
MSGVAATPGAEPRGRVQGYRNPLTGVGTPIRGATATPLTGVGTPIRGLPQPLDRGGDPDSRVTATP